MYEELELILAKGFTMSSQQFREHYVLPHLRDNMADIEYILGHISGGWEVWLQVALGMRISRAESGEFSREKVYYQGSGVQYDLRVKSQKGAAVYFEIKTQINNADFSTAPRFQNDINKISALNSQFKKENVIIAFAFSRLSNQREMNSLGHLLSTPRITAYSMTGENLNRTLTPNTPTLFWYSAQ